VPITIPESFSLGDIRKAVTIGVSGLDLTRYIPEDLGQLIGRSNWIVLSAGCSSNTGEKPAVYQPRQLLYLKINGL